MKQITTLTICFIFASFIYFSFAIAVQYNPEVYQAQKTLMDLGYKPGRLDGLWGDITQRAIERFQRDMGIPVTGRLDEETKERLGIKESDKGIKIFGQVKTKLLALVIGNGAYKSSPLRNPVNDANDMARVLTKLGFDVIHQENTDHRAMEDAIRNFGRQLRNKDVGLFYFSGHGMQVKGRNYLVPIDANIGTESDVIFETVDAGRVLGKMEDAGNYLNIVILDACRDNPLARNFRTSSQGLARMDAPTGTFITYATAPGSVAADGFGRNGVFTKYLLQNMTQPGLKIEDVMKRVRNAVMHETGNKQVPWQSSSLTGDFYFVPKKAPPMLEHSKAKLQPYKTDVGIERMDYVISLLEQALTLQEDGGDTNFRKALTLLNKALEVDPNAEAAYHNRGIIYKSLKEYSKAIQDFNKAIDLHPNDAANYGSRADIYIDLKEYSKAIQDHNKIIEIEPNSASNHFSRGVIYDGWLKEYSKAIHLLPLYTCLLSRLMTDKGCEQERKKIMSNRRYIY